MSNNEETKLLTVSQGPHIRRLGGTSGIMLSVVIALIPAFVWGIYVFGLRAAVVVGIAVASAIVSEALCQLCLRRKITVSDGSAAVTGLLIGLNLPVSVPLWMPLVGSVFAIVVVKQIFGGLGRNFLNPALAARVFLFSWASEMTAFTAPGVKLPVFGSELDAVATATPLSFILEGQLPPDVTLFDAITGNMPGCIGEISAVLLILGGVFLLVRRVITWHIPVTFIGTVFLLSYLFPIGDLDIQFPLYSIFSGGLMLGAFFMATDYVTSPITASGKVIFGVGCGALTVFIRYFGGYPEGVSFAILIMNVLVPFINKLTVPTPYGSVKKAKKEGEKNEK